MIDLHCHLLPGVDDGPDSLEESLALCRIAVADGITHSIVTPHIHPGRWENNKASIEHDSKALQQALDEHNIPLKLGFAGEVRLTDQIMRQVENDEIPFYGEVDGYQIMLLEFPHGHIIPGSEKLVEWLLGRKIRPLIAHPERNREVMRDVSKIEPFVEMGCMLQLTGGSLLGLFGGPVENAAYEILNKGWVDVVASDGHNKGSRRPELSIVYGVITKYLGSTAPTNCLLKNQGIIAAKQIYSESDVHQSIDTDIHFHD